VTSFDYTATAATALRLLTKFGAACVLKRQTAGDYDADQGAALVIESELASIAAVFEYPARYIDGTLIKQGDRQAFLRAEPVPVQGDRLEWSSSDWTVVSVKAIAPAGVTVMYECQIRGAGAPAADVEVIIDGGGDS